MKAGFLNALRQTTCYASLRRYAALLSFVIFLGGLAWLVLGVMAGGWAPIIFGVVQCLVTMLIAKVIYEATRALADCADLALHVAAKGRSATVIAADGAASEHTAQPTPSDAERALMAEYGISYEDGQFVYGKYRFESAEGAIRYANQYPLGKTL